MLSLKGLCWQGLEKLACLVCCVNAFGPTVCVSELNKTDTVRTQRQNHDRLLKALHCLCVVSLFLVLNIVTLKCKCASESFLNPSWMFCRH